VAIAAALVALRPVSFTLQFLVGAGLPVLCLAALGLARFRPAVTLAVAIPFAATAFIATRDALALDPSQFVPASRMQAVLALRDGCKELERVLAPPETGLLPLGLTRCWPYVSHRAAPGFSERAAVVAHFFEGADAAWRAAFLERACVSYVLAPPGLDLALDRLPGVSFEAVGSRVPAGDTLWRRVAPPACVPGQASARQGTTR
jgi:hypothetical protein